MATAKCGWCGKDTHMTEHGNGKKSGNVAGISPDLPKIQQAFRCDQCGRLSIGSYWGHDTPGSVTESTLATFWERYPLQNWAPTYVEGQHFPDVPLHIAAAAGEAHKSASIGNRMSAILMARTVIEATAKDKKITKGTLQAKIEAMLKEGLVRLHIKESADEIRYFGNDMAHGDIAEPVDDDDVSEVLALMDEVLNEVYQSHARLAKVREKRLAKKDAGA